MSNCNTFADFGIDVPYASGEVCTICPECSHTRKKSTEKCLAVNADKGVWYCHHCHWSGALKAERSAYRAIQAPVKVKQDPGRRDYAKRCWQAAIDCEIEQHPYAIDKGIHWAAGARRGIASGVVIGDRAECLLIPCRDLITHELLAVQAINTKGKKQTFGAMDDGALILGNTLDKFLPWYICEGWADSVSLVFHHHHGNAVAAAAFGLSRLERVAQAVSKTYAPECVVIVHDQEAA